MTREYTYHIYSLKDPRDGKVRYIGCTTDPKTRYRRHFRETENARKFAWIQSLSEEGLKPIIEVLQTCSDKYEASELEKFHYAQYDAEDLFGNPIHGIGYANAGTMNDKRIHDFTIKISDNTLGMIKQLCPARNMRHAEALVSRLLLDEFLRVQNLKRKVIND